MRTGRDEGTGVERRREGPAPLTRKTQLTRGASATDAQNAAHPRGGEEGASATDAQNADHSRGGEEARWGWEEESRKGMERTRHGGRSTNEDGKGGGEEKDGGAGATDAQNADHSRGGEGKWGWEGGWRGGGRDRRH